MDDLKDKIQRIDIAALARRAEESEALERYAGANASLTFAFLISKLQDEGTLVKHLAEALERIDEYARHAEVVDSKLAVIVRDAAETRRLTMSAVERVNTLAQVVGAGMDEIARVSKNAEDQAKELRVQAEKTAVEAREQKARVDTLAADFADQD